MKSRRKLIIQMIFSASLVVALLLAMPYALANEKEDSDMTHLEFFQSLDYEAGLDVVVKILERFPLQYATTLGRDGNPQIRPIEFKFEENGVRSFWPIPIFNSACAIRRP